MRMVERLTKPSAVAVALVASIAISLVAAPLAAAQTLAGAELGKLLRQGGYVLVVRHAHAPAEPPPAAVRDPANVASERQLDASGREAAAALGRGIRSIGAPVGQVLSSPAFRAIQTVQAAGLPAPQIAEPLGDGGRSMSAIGSDPAAWLRRAAATAPAAGSNTILVTHQPNIVAAFALSDVGEGEALVFQPSDAGAKLVGRIKPDGWPALR